MLWLQLGLAGAPSNQGVRGTKPPGIPGVRGAKPPGMQGGLGGRSPPNGFRADGARILSPTAFGRWGQVGFEATSFRQRPAATIFKLNQFDRFPN